MHYYCNHIPNKETIVIAKLNNEDESEFCFYVELPEYDNIQGVIQKSELPKKIKTRNKMMALMRRCGTIPCTVSAQHDEGEIIELSVRDIESQTKELIMDRYFNIQKILKMTKYICEEFDLKFDEQLEKLHEQYIYPINITDSNSFDDYSKLYQNFLTNHKMFTSLFDLDSDMEINIDNKLTELIKEIETSSTLKFDLAVWKSEKDAIYIIRELFIELNKQFPQIELRYVGAPTYQLILPKIKTGMIDNQINDIKNFVQDWMKKSNVTGYGLNFDLSKKEIKNGDISISYPYKIELL